MKKGYVEVIKTIALGVFLVALNFLGKGKSNNREVLLYIGGLLILIGIIEIFMEKFSKNKVNKKIGYVNKYDERNVSIRCKAGNTTYQIISIAMWIVFGISFSGILPVNQFNANWPIFAVVAISLIDIIFVGYYANRE
jgi:uncharacterized membrane protein